MEINGPSKKVFFPKRAIYERRVYATRRTLMALERVSIFFTSSGSIEEIDRAFRWVELWSDFAVPEQSGERPQLGQLINDDNQT